MRIRIFHYLFAILFISGYTTLSYGQDIVVHKDNPVESITVRDLKDIYFGRKNFWSATNSSGKINPVYNHGNIKRDFLKMLNSSESDFRRHWYKLTYAGLADPPKGAQDDAEVIKRVSQEKGGIGFVTPGRAVDERIKVIRVIP